MSRVRLTDGPDEGDGTNACNGGQPGLRHDGPLPAGPATVRPDRIARDRRSGYTGQARATQDTGYTGQAQFRYRILRATLQ